MFRTILLFVFLTLFGISSQASQSGRPAPITYAKAALYEFELAQVLQSLRGNDKDDHWPEILKMISDHYEKIPRMNPSQNHLPSTLEALRADGYELDLERTKVIVKKRDLVTPFLVEIPIVKGRQRVSLLRLKVLLRAPNAIDRFWEDKPSGEPEMLLKITSVSHGKLINTSASGRQLDRPERYLPGIVKELQDEDARGDKRHVVNALKSFLVFHESDTNFQFDGARIKGTKLRGGKLIVSLPYVFENQTVWIDILAKTSNKKVDSDLNSALLTSLPGIRESVVSLQETDEESLELSLLAIQNVYEETTGVDLRRMISVSCTQGRDNVMYPFSLNLNTAQFLMSEGIRMAAAFTYYLSTPQVFILENLRRPLSRENPFWRVIVGAEEKATRFLGLFFRPGGGIMTFDSCTPGFDQP